MKKEEHPPSRENAQCKFALSQGALALSQGAYPYSKSKDTTIVRIIKGFFGFLGEIPGQARNDVGEIPGQARNEEERARNEEGGARCFDRLSNRAPSGPSTGSGTGRASDEGAGPSTGSGTGRASDKGWPALRRAQGPGHRPALRQAQGPAEQA